MSTLMELLMSINHDNEYHGDINYGHLFPEDWYWYELTEEESQLEDSTKPIDSPNGY